MKTGIESQVLHDRVFIEEQEDFHGDRHTVLRTSTEILASNLSESGIRFLKEIKKAIDEKQKEQK